MMLFNIGDEEMAVGELTLLGCYLGSNVTYNVKAMVEQDYLAQQRSLHDRRSIRVRLTEKEKQLRDGLMAVHSRHANMLPHAAVTLRQAGSNPYRARYPVGRRSKSEKSQFRAAGQRNLHDRSGAEPLST